MDDIEAQRASKKPRNWRTCLNFIKGIGLLESDTGM